MPAQNERAAKAAQTAMPAPAVDQWLALQAAFARPILTYLRASVQEAAPDATEEIKWNRPFFVVNGTLIAHMAAFKQHCGFGFWSPQMTSMLAADGIVEPGASGSFGRLVSLDNLPPRPTLLRYIRHAAELARAGKGGSSMASGPRRGSAKAPVPAPPEFTAALAASTAAQTSFDSMAPSCRREYLEWIASAKKPETRTRRVEEAIERLAAGKRRHDQYRRPRVSA